jgi:hypothetical protein
LTKRFKASDFAIMALVIIVSLSALSVSLLFGGHPQKANILQTGILPIEKTASTQPIGLETAIDYKQNIHLIWINDDQVLHYQKSSDKGLFWSEPVTLFNAEYEYVYDPRIYTEGDTITVFWMHNSLYLIRSTDDGRSWGKTTCIMEKYNFLKGTLDHYNVILKNGVFYAVYGDYVNESVSATCFSKSSDAGRSWSKPVQIAPYAQSSSRDPLSVDIEGNTIYVLCEVKERLPNYSITKAYLAHSDDLGESWDTSKNFVLSAPEENTDPPIPSNNYTIVNQGESLLVFFQQEHYLFFTKSLNKGDTWSEPVKLANWPILQYSLHQNPSGDISFIWIDMRHQKRDLLGYIPVVNFFIGDLEWTNNDLYYGTFGKGGLHEGERLSPPLSYIQWYTSIQLNSVACGNIGDQLLVLWAGKKKIGKYAHNSPEPYRIFYKMIGGGNEN